MNTYEQALPSTPDEETPVSPDDSVLAAKYERIRVYAESQAENGFVRVYRAEGGKQEAAFGGQAQLAGTWFSPSYEYAKSFRDRRAGDGSENMRIVSLVIPKSLLDDREAIDIGMNQVNVLNADLISGAKEVDSADDSVPMIDDYIGQFSFAEQMQAKNVDDAL